MEVRWSEGEPSPDFTRTIFLYIDGHLKGFVAESGVTGWLAFKFSNALSCKHSNLEDAKKELLESILKKGTN